MTIKQQLTEDMKSAMRAKEMSKLTTIRFLLSEIKNYEIDQGEQDDAGIQKVIASQVKKMNDAIADFLAAGREDLVAEEKEKVAVLSAYLPEQLSDAELEQVVIATIADVGLNNQGQLIGAVMKKVAGRADGNRVSAIVKQQISVAKV